MSLLGTVALPAHSQPITPANDGTGTTVNQNGNQFNIQGGTHNGTNLFHSFGKFNLNSGQTANFISTPDTRNILGRITGGDPSRINGLIQVIGGNSNLFLMNPAGIMFGQNASLNIPASFSVTTATGIGFNSNNFWFQAIGTNDYSNLVGDPSGYNFNVSNPGAIVNEGILSLNPGKDLTLAGGTVINTGELSTAGGNITIAAVNGGDTLRISQPGHLLSLDVSPTSNNLSGQSITPILLPELLTGGDIHHASSVVINAQGNLELTDTAGLAIASGNINVSDTSTDGTVGGQVNVLGDRVAVIDANINANGLKVGGKILIGGDFQGDGIVPNSQQTFVNNNSIISADAINNGEGGQVIIWSDDTTNFAGNISAKGGHFSGDGGFVEISGKEQLIFDGNVNVTAAFGETGTILFDPKNIIIGGSESSNESPEPNEDDNVTFSVAEIEEIEGEIILQADNDITVNEPIETSESVELKAGRNININADIDTSQSNGNISLFGNDNSANINNRDQGAGSINQREGTTLNSGSGDITIRLGNLGTNGDINLANLTTTGQLLINANQGNIRQVSPNSLITAERGIFETQNSGGIGLAEAPLRIDVNNLEVLTGEQGLFISSISDLTIGGVSEELTGIYTRGGGNIELNIDGNFTAIEEVVTSVPDRQPGTITISSTGNIDTTETTLKSNSESTTGGDISLTADGNIQTGDINASTMGNDRGGNITINSGGEVETTAGEIFSASFDGDGGNVGIISNGNIKTGYIDSRSDGSGNGGNITLKTTGGNVDTSSEELASFSVRGNAGNVSITSNGDIKTADIFSSAGDPLDADGDLANSSPFQTNNTDSNQTQSANGSGGDITLTAEGIIDTSAGTIESFSRLGDGGSVSITSKGDITTGEIVSAAGEPEAGVPNNNNTPPTTPMEINSGSSGNITIESTEGAITATAEIGTFGDAGNAGDVTINAFGDIKTESIESRTGGGEGGDITIESRSGTVDTRVATINTMGTEAEEDVGIFSASEKGNAGNITINSKGDLSTGNINSSSLNGRGGNITLESTGGIDTSSGEISSLSQTGDAGNVTIGSNGDLITGNIDSNSKNGQGGNITLESTGGIDTTGVTVDTMGNEEVAGIFSASEEGNAGNITITSNGNLTTGNIDSNSKNGNGGNIALESTGGNIDTTGGELASFSELGDAGNVTIASNRDLSTGNIDSRSKGSGQGGNITLESLAGNIDTTGGEIASFSELGDAGDVTIISSGDLSTGDIDSRSNGSGQGGNITLESTGGNIDTTGGEIASLPPVGNDEDVETSNDDTGSELSSFSELGDAGDVTITSNGGLKTANINSRSKGSGQGGSITLESTNGSVDTTVGEIVSRSQAGNAGSVTIKSLGDIQTGNIDSQTQAGQGGDITIESTGGSIETLGTEEDIAGIFATSEEGNAGSVTITSNGNLTTGNIDSRSTNGDGGNISLESIGANIDTSAAEVRSSSRRGNAGNVSLTSQGNIKTGRILSFAGRGIDEEEDSDNSSLNQSGSSNGGDITLKAGGTIDTTAGANDQSKLESFSREGLGGNISLEAKGDITTAQILSTAGDPEASNPEDNTNITPLTEAEINERSSGNIRIESTEGAVTTTAEINSFATSGNGGSVTIKSRGNLTTSDINSRSDVNGQGGNITLESTDGNVNTTDGELSSFSRSGDAGDVTITSNGDLITGDIFSSSGNPRNPNNEDNSEEASGPQANPQPTDNPNPGENTGGAGGSITLIAEGEINTTAGVIESFSRRGAGGDISLEAKGNITTNEIISSAGDPENIRPTRENTENTNTTQPETESETGSPGGDITLQSIEGNVTTQGELISYSSNGDGGNVSIISNGEVSTVGIDSRAENRGRGGSISIQNQTGSIETIGGELASSSRTGDGGNVEITSTDDIIIETIFSESEGDGNGGDVTITVNGNIQIGTIESFAGGSGQGGNISITANGAIDASIGELVSSSQTGEGGNITLNATGDISTGFIESFSGAGARGGNITLETINGNIDTTVGFLGEEVNIPTDADVSSEDVATIFEQELANLSSYAPEGTGGNIVIIQRGQGDITTSNISSFGGNSSGAVNITNNDGNINTGVIFSTAINGTGDRISIETVNNGDLNINHIATYSTADDGTGGQIELNASGVVNINNVASFGNAGSGDVSITSNITSNSGSINTGTIQTRAPNGTSGNITLNTFSTQGDIRTANVSTEGGEAAGTVEIIAADGSVTTEDLQSISESGNAGGIDVQAGEDIETGDQTVDSATGDSNINNEAGGDITTGDQTATTEEGNANINNEAGGDITTGDQTATTQQGDANINNQATGNITTGDQTAVTNQGDANINNEATGNITTGDQTAITNQGDANINNQATGNITTGDQTAITNQGDANINNEATGNITTGDQTAVTNQGNANINNEATGNITTGDQTAVTNQGNASINNEATGNITTGDQTAVTNQGNASINNQAAGNITTTDQVAIGDTTNITNLPGGELNTGEIIQISPPPSIPIDNTLPQQLPQIPANQTIPGASNPVQPITPAIPANNILPPNNPISNPTATNIIQSVQSNSTISTTNNPNLPNKKSDRQQININTDTTTALQNINIINNTPLTVAANFQTLTALEKNRNNSFTNYFGEDLSTQNISIKNGGALTDNFGEDLSTQNTSIKNIREVLTDIARETGKKSAIIYVTAYQEELQLILYTSGSDPILKTVPAANHKQLMEVVLQLRAQITNPSRRNTQSYLPPAQKLYNWLIAPISAELEAANIDTLLFSMDEGLRTLPVAALHDGQQFLVEKYSLSLIPSISLMDTNYRPIQDTRVLAMGASEFTAQSSLPAVPVELETISQQLWQGSQFLNQDFTRNNLLTQRQNYPYPIVHLATHAEFRPGAISNSYIQLWGNQKLKLDQIRELGWNDPPVELLVLSACRTAVGDKNAELGFAGLAVAAGAKSALASVWYVSDEGTLGLMTEFYTQLNNAKIKAEALQQAQLAMLRGEVVIAEGQLRGTAARGAVVLPSELGKFENQNLSHPYYWAGFMMIGSPW
ncbi:MAG: CHAT domain-containing protein [Okeania sp. SIO2C2]|nr:CHAT domain-containing protein [Okeania sp. SIO2C2]NEP91066.1 CHAT domain-containing protein [Okeania sp. SIO2C2]